MRQISSLSPPVYSTEFVKHSQTRMHAKDSFTPVVFSKERRHFFQQRLDGHFFMYVSQRNSDVPLKLASSSSFTGVQQMLMKWSEMSGNVRPFKIVCKK